MIFIFTPHPDAVKLTLLQFNSPLFLILKNELVEQWYIKSLVWQYRFFGIGYIYRGLHIVQARFVILGALLL